MRNFKNFVQGLFQEERIKNLKSNIVRNLYIWIAVFTVAFVVGTLSLRGCLKNKGIEGKWDTYTYRDLYGKRTKSKIMVSESWCKERSNRNWVGVWWKVVNTSKTPSSFGWKNKYLIDKNGRVYSPYSGVRSKKLQPIEGTDQLYVEYYIPKGVKVSKLWWGLYYEDEGLQYRIKLTPRFSL